MRAQDAAFTEPGPALRDALEHIRAGRPDQAEALCRRLASRFSAMADIHHLLGIVALGRKDAASAATAFRRAIALAPGIAHYHTNHGTALREADALSEAAERNYRRALWLAPDQAETLYNRANLLTALGRNEEALRSYRAAIALQPGRDKLRYNLGNLFLKMQRPADAVRAYEAANVLAGGRFHDATVNLGMARQKLNALPEALACYEEALRVQPDNPAAHWNRALAWLLSGRFEEGWRGYEWRWRLADVPPRRFDQPVWQGEPLAGKTILLHAEQGLGDTLQFARYAPLVMALGARVLLECQAPLRRLLAASLPEAVVLSDGDPLPEFDVHLPLLSLPRLFRTTLETIPGRAPYLRPPPSPGVAALRLPSDRLAVGLVWGGDPAHRNDQQRSLDPNALSGLLATPGVAFVSLQKGERARALDRLTAEFGVIDGAADLDDFADTAARLAQLDLVVTVDTSVAHLAGGLGCPACVMLPFAPDWRWLLDRRDSPWYPAATLFRQETPGDWTTVVDRVAAHLQDAASRISSPNPPLRPVGQPDRNIPFV